MTNVEFFLEKKSNLDFFLISKQHKKDVGSFRWKGVFLSNPPMCLSSSSQNLESLCSIYSQNMKIC
jgi:hypothetical protein